MKLRCTFTAVREVEVKPEWLQRHDHKTELKETITTEQLRQEWAESIKDDPFSFIDNNDYTPVVSVEVVE